jgi:hypothetical protein
MVATAILGVAFVGVYTLVMLAERSMRNAIAKEKLQIVANQILEVIESDLTNVDSYNLNLKVCTAPGASPQTYQTRSYEWCRRLNGEVGAAVAAETRSISVTTWANGQKVVSIILQAKNAAVEVIMKRAYDN